MNNFRKGLIAGAIALMSVGANAQIITHGYLSSDTNGDIIADTTNGREYMRFDTFDWTVAQTVTATSTGGAYESWTIADSAINDDFINAIFAQSGSNACSTGVDFGNEYCGNVAGWVDGDFGESHSPTNDFYAYISDGGADYGLTMLLDGGDSYEYNSWSHQSSLDTHSLTGNGSPINLLLYRDNATASVTNGLGAPASVPLPASLGLLGLAMTGFGFRRKEK